MRFWKLLPNPLMWSCQVEVGHIPIENPVELLLVEDQQVVKAFLTPEPILLRHLSDQCDGFRSYLGRVRRGF